MYVYIIYTLVYLIHIYIYIHTHKHRSADLSRRLLRVAALLLVARAALALREHLLNSVSNYTYICMYICIYIYIYIYVLGRLMCI